MWIPAFAGMTVRGWDEGNSSPARGGVERSETEGYHWLEVSPQRATPLRHALRSRFGCATSPYRGGFLLIPKPARIIPAPIIPAKAGIHGSDNIAR
jgi:hypothetical protein